MGWLWGDSSTTTQTPNDPYSQLDRSLKDFLNKESLSSNPVPQTRPSPASPDAASNTYRSQLGLSQEAPAHAQPSIQQHVPPESLFQDGRYSDLWKGYRTRVDIEAAGKTESDKLHDVIGAYKDRRAAIGRAAVENCVMEQMAERDCWENGTMMEKMNMCRGPGRQFMRCYTMQSRFLKALGYLGLDRTEEEEERIQMHADTLYHEMLAREERAEEARKQGLEVEKLPPLVTQESVTQALGQDSAYARNLQRSRELGESSGLKLSDYTPERQEQIKKQLRSLRTPEEREVEMQLIAAERRSQLEIAERVREGWAEEQKSREGRRERGKENVGDTIKRLWGWDK
ncbi:hypothetical protein LTR53_000792 [Teratosphaeriaceae sp. CCFEE 6253]|nr:hypothetical protein LTR53_000792 [Teratosphaeriaceae sp. CCFEE 6253]